MMNVTLLPMSPAEFSAFRSTSVLHHAYELMLEEHYTKEDALKEAESELIEMLPQGSDTPNNYIYTIAADGNENIGYLWFLIEEFNGILQSFLCDFYIIPTARKNGYGKAALHEYHRLAADSGCAESVLFVSNRNIAAQRLYCKSGYVFYRNHNYGCFIKLSLNNSEI